MNNIKKELENALSEKLAANGLELEIVPVPTKGDRMVRIRTLEEALDEFDLSGSEESGIGYLIQVRPVRKTVPDPAIQAAADSAEEANGVYLKSGKLNCEFLFKNATLLFQAQDYELTINILKKVLETGQKTSDSHFLMGRALECQGKTTEAASHYQEALLFGPTIEIVQTLSNVLIKQKKHAEAAAVLERGLAIDGLATKVRIDVLKAAANSYLQANEIHTAERLIKKAIELDQKNDSLLSNLGSIYLRMGQTSLAKKYFSEALTLHPKSPKALTGYGSCLLSEGSGREAHDTFAQSLDLEIAQPTAIYHLVKLAYELKIYATAARLLENYCSSSPVNLNLLYTLAGLQFHLDRMEDARDTTRRILDLQPEYQKARDLLKRIEDKNKNFIKEDGAYGSRRRETSRSDTGSVQNPHSSGD